MSGRLNGLPTFAFERFDEPSTSTSTIPALSPSGRSTKLCGQLSLPSGAAAGAVVTVAAGVWAHAAAGIVSNRIVKVTRCMVVLRVMGSQRVRRERSERHNRV